RLKFKSFDNLLTKPLFVPPTMALSDLLASMQQAYTHIGIVVDEHGGIIGIVTMEDALEELVGEIWDESDIVRSEVKQLDGKVKYVMQRACALDKFFDLFNINHEDEWLSSTVRGLIIDQFERIAHNDDTLQYKRLEITVVNAQQQRDNEIIAEKIIED